MATQDNSPIEPAGADNPSDGTFDSAVQEELRRMGNTEGESENEPGDGQSDPDNPDDATDPDVEDTQDTDPDADNAEEEGADAQAGPTTEIEFNGEKFKIPEKLKPAFLMQEDYSRKTAVLADVGKAIQARAQQAEELFQQGQQFGSHFAAAQQVDAQAGEIIQFLQQNPRLSAIDPVQFATLTGQLQMLSFQRNGITTSLNEAKSKFDQFNAQQTQQSIADGVRVAQEKIPNWGGETAKAIASYAARSGIRPETFMFLDNGADPMALVALNKARLWDDLQAKKPQLQKKIASSGPPLRPGSVSQNQPRQSVDVLGKKLRSSGSVNDAVALELARMTGGRRR